MKEYPSIEALPGPIAGNYYVFDKLDGSNIRAEMSKKLVFNKFGKRHGLLDDSYPILRRSEELINDKYTDMIAMLMKKNKWENVTCFFEFLGPSSFAGWHNPDEQQDVILLDIWIHKRGFIEPKELVKVIGEEFLPRLLSVGNVTKPIIEQVSNGTLPGMSFEGIVVKGPYNKKTGMLDSYKWKNIAWLKKLKEKVTPEEYEKLK